MDTQEIDDKLKHLWMYASDVEKNYIRKDHALALDSRQFYDIYTLGSPLISTKEVGILLIKEGTARYTIDYQKHNVKAGSLLILPPNVIFSIDWKSPDFYPYGLSFTHQFIGLSMLNNSKLVNMLDEALHLKIEDGDMAMFLAFFYKMKYFLDNGSPDLSGFKSVILSFLYILYPIAEQNKYNAPPKAVTHRHEVFLDFLKLLRGMDIPERSVKHYAEALNVTENYLSTAVKEESGRTVMQYINEKTVACIKIYLAKDVPLEEIAEKTKLGNTSSLGRFFKKETGQTPMEYKTSNK